MLLQHKPEYSGGLSCFRSLHGYLLNIYHALGSKVSPEDSMMKKIMVCMTRVPVGLSTVPLTAPGPASYGTVQAASLGIRVLI